MDRLQKKCFIASTGFHLLLLVILVVGPAFLLARSKPDDMPILDFVPVKTVDALVSGGGNPNGSPPPPPLPPAPKPAPPVEQHPPAPELPSHEERQPDPPKEVVKPVESKPQPDSLEPAKEKKKRLPDINPQLITRPKETEAEKKAREQAQEEAAKAEAEARAYARQVADLRRRTLSALGNAANSLDDARSSTSIELKGPGGGGVPYANFLQAVKSIYERAWIVPDGVTDDDATVAVAVTIARDGTVVSSRVVRGSGNAAVDQSVRVTLRRVTFAAPLPEGATESERTVTINFNVAAKRASG